MPINSFLFGWLNDLYFFYCWNDLISWKNKNLKIYFYFFQQFKITELARAISISHQHNLATGTQNTLNHNQNTKTVVENTKTVVKTTRLLVARRLLCQRWRASPIYAFDRCHIALNIDWQLSQCCLLNWILFFMFKENMLKYGYNKCVVEINLLIHLKQE